MRSLIIAITVALAAASSYAAIDIPMDAQINIGRMTASSPSGDAIHPRNEDAVPNTLMFMADEPEGYARLVYDGSGQGSWAYGPYVDFYLAGVTDDWIDVTQPDQNVMKFETRVYNDPVSNTNPYGDANVFVRIYTYEDDGSGTWPTYLGHRDFGIVYGPNLLPGGDDLPYPTWTEVTVDLSGGTDGGTFDPTRVSKLRFYGTNWAGGGDDFVDIKNLSIVPEPTTLSLLGLAGLAFLRRRK